MLSKMHVWLLCVNNDIRIYIVTHRQTSCCMYKNFVFYIVLHFGTGHSLSSMHMHVEHMYVYIKNYGSELRGKGK